MTRERRRPLRAHRAWALVPVALAIVVGCSPSSSPPQPAAEDHGHDHPDAAGGGVAVTVWTERSELFFEHPPLLAGLKGDPWAVHVTRLSDFSPVTEGRLVAAFRGADGDVFTTEAPAPIRPGIYAIAPVLPKAGSYETAVAIEGPQLEDRIDAGRVMVFADAESLPPPQPDAGGGEITFLKEQQWPIDFAVARVASGEVPVTVAAVGEIVPAADRLAQVAAPVAGLALAAGNLSAPAEGARVRAGQILITVSPTLGDDSYAFARERVERLELEVGRLSRLFAVEAVAEKRLLEARHELEIAEAAMAALGDPGGESWDFPVKAPLSGVVRARHFVPGQRVAAGAALFEILDPSHVWLRLKVPAQHASRVADASSAVFEVEGDSRQREAGPVVSVAATIDSHSRTLPVTLAVDNRAGELKIGHLVRARLAVGGTVAGLVVPDAAIQIEDGQPVAYVQTGGESFVRRPLGLGPGDGTHTLVQSGLSEGEHVVTRGAYDVYLASLSTSEIGDHGHPH